VHTLAVAAFLYFLACLFGALEVEAEGRFGWAEKFPTWYRVDSGRLVRFYVKQLNNNRPMTGYHIPMTLATIAIFIWPLIYIGHLTAASFVASFGAWSAWVVMWDSSWFVMNPHYGLEKFRPDKIWWFSQDKDPWIFRVPSSYLKGWGLALGLAAISGWISGGTLHRLALQAEELGWYAIFSLLLIFAGGPLYRGYYWHMRRDANSHDQRDRAGIPERPA
jgi:hypothetical protein